MWCLPGKRSAEFVCAMKDVLDVYRRPYDPARPQVCVDETRKQLVGEGRTPLPTRPGQPQRFDHEYNRNGVANLFMIVEPLTGACHVKVTEQRTRVDWAHLLCDRVDVQYPHAAVIVLVTDNLNGRYKDLALVESAFRTCKTVELQVRPVHVRKASRTRGHVLVVALAYRIVRELARLWRRLDTTVQEGLNQLAQLCATDLLEADRTLCVQIPEPRPEIRTLLQAADIQLPQALPGPGAVVTTKRKLPERRKKT